MSDAERPLGITEAFTVVRDQCTSGAVQKVARQALDAVARDGASALPLQAFYLLTAVRGWQGPQSARVKKALEAFLAERERAGAGGGS